MKEPRNSAAERDEESVWVPAHGLARLFLQGPEPASEVRQLLGYNPALSLGCRVKGKEEKEAGKET